MHPRMFTILSDVWLLIQMIATICLSCWIYGEIRKPAIQQQIDDATAEANTKIEKLHGHITKINTEASRVGWKFEFKKGI
jgi:hypothetical protein